MLKRKATTKRDSQVAFLKYLSAKSPEKEPRTWNYVHHENTTEQERISEKQKGEKR